jgi:heterodisulfide reductase subunit A-like polyferredoxin
MPAAIAQLLSKGSAMDAEKYKNYVESKTITVTELVDVQYHSTLCSVCEHMCHERCGITYSPDTNSPELSGCACMGPGNQCRVCPRKCPSGSHYHANKIYKTVRHDDSVIEQALPERDVMLIARAHLPPRNADHKDRGERA